MSRLSHRLKIHRLRGIFARNYGGTNTGAVRRPWRRVLTGIRMKELGESSSRIGDQIHANATRIFWPLGNEAIIFAVFALNRVSIDSLQAVHSPQIKIEVYRRV